MVVAVPRRVRRRVALLVTLALALLVAIIAFRWWGHYVESRLGRWAVDELARNTGGTYRLVLGDLSFLPLDGSISFDSAIVATDSARNRQRETPLPALEWRANQCRISGIDLLQLLLRRSFVARGLACDRVVGNIALLSPSRENSRTASDSTSFVGPEENVVRPLGLSSFRIAEVSLPALVLTLTRPGGRRGGGSIHLEHARFEASDLELDPTAPPGQRRMLRADRARLSGTGLLLRPDTLVEIEIARVEAGLTDSTLRLVDARHEPSIPENEWVRRVRTRRDRIRFELDSLRGRGMAYRAFLTDGDIGIRALELDGARLDVLTDKRMPRGRSARHRTPQQIAARADSAVRLDTIIVTGGTIVYRERKVERERPGIVTFDSVRATILNLHLPSKGQPLRIEARARLMNAGVLNVEATVPLDAPDFRYQLSGRLGRMPATAFNRFLSENESFELESGRVEGIIFQQTVRGGRATTTITPRYRDLSVETPGDGGGLVGEVKEFLADALVVRSRNPDEDGKNLRTARTVRRYDPSQSWAQFLWLSLRDGLYEVLKE